MLLSRLTHRYNDAHMYFDETLAMRNIGGRMWRARASGWLRNMYAFSVFSFKTPLVRNAVLEKLEIVNYLDKHPSQIRLFKNKFAIARNTRDLR